MIALLVAAAVAAQDCNRAPTAIAKDECELNESLASDKIQPFDCKGRQTQADMNVCSYRDYLRADIELNRTWDAVTKKISKDAPLFRTLLAGQRAWLTYRDKQCEVWAKWYEGGTIASLMVNTCLTDITKFRTKELGQLLEDN
jgi:uncharacterized protein YecT (DUF1311 family)